MEAVQEEMQCINHPYKKSSPGGICALCLQDKLGKLVSSSFSAAVFPSSSPSPSFRSHTATATNMQFQQPPHSHYPPPPPPSSNHPNHCTSYNTSHYHTRTPRLPFVLPKNRKNKDGDGFGMEGPDPTTIVFKRSKSIATPEGRILDETPGQHYSPHRRRGFWSFLHTSSKHSTPKKVTNNNHMGSSSSSSSSSLSRDKKRAEDMIVMVDENASPDGRKVSRSRSVGCGSRSFSGDLFERISTGFSDCTLRRVESQREGNPKGQPIAMNAQDYCIKQRLSCVGIFSGFMVRRIVM